VRAGVSLGVAALMLMAVVACGGSPTTPGNVPPPPGPIVTDNTPPVIESIAASVSRTEVDTDVTLTASVRDVETPTGQLRYEWSADVGTFTGQGTSVTWRAPKGMTTPTDVTIRLRVTETYGTTGAQQNVVNGSSPAIRVHDSQKELGALSLAFLGDFANSSVSPSTCVRDFTDSCPGKADEKRDVEHNREHFTIVGSSLELKSVQIASDAMRANMTVACRFTSRVDKCEAGSSGCTVGSVGTVAGDCALTAVYEQQRWWLCTSNFFGANVPNLRHFFGRKE
jgi:hypothetical protein